MHQARQTYRRPYPSDLSDAEWTILEPLLPAEKSGGRQRGYELREIINALQGSQFIITSNSGNATGHDSGFMIIST
jgi:hypothetical protein